MPSADSAPASPLGRVAIAGASGLLGSALAVRLRKLGATVHRLRRGGRAISPDIAWSPGSRTIDLAALEGVDAVVNLAGAPIAERWTKERKNAIRESRLTSTSLLADAFSKLDRPPRVFLSGSAIGIYGSRGDELLDEESAPGSDFLSDVAVAWEQAAAPARVAAVRVVLLRTGIVLSRSGGALAKMLTPFRFGLGGRIGSGKQWMSWIGLCDWVDAALFLLSAPAVDGPVNVVAPAPVPNEEFTKTLAHVLGRPSLGFVPEALVELAFGEMGRATILASQRVEPKRLLRQGFKFTHPTLEQALRAELASG